MGLDCSPHCHVSRAKLRVLGREERLGSRSLDSLTRVHSAEAQRPAVGAAGALDIAPVLANDRIRSLVPE